MLFSLKTKPYKSSEQTCYKNGFVFVKENPYEWSEQGVCHIVALSFRLKSIVRQKKDYGKSNISSCKNIIFKKIFAKKPKSFKILL